MYIEHLFSSIYIIYNQCYDEYIDKHRFKIDLKTLYIGRSL